MNKRNISQQTCCKSLICAFCWALFSFPLSISDLSLLIVSKRVSCFSVIICLLCEDKNVIQKAAPTTPRQWKLKLSVISSIVSLRNRTPNAWPWLWKTWRGYYLRVLSGIHLTLMFFALLQKDLFEGMWSLARRRKGGFAWITPSLWSPRTQAYGLFNLVFSRQTGFSSAHIRLLINRWSKTEPAIPSRRLLGSAGRVGSLLVCTWCHRSYVDGQEQKHFSPLGTKLYFHVNSTLKNSILLIPNMAALWRGCNLWLFKQRRVEVQTFFETSISL